MQRTAIDVAQLFAMPVHCLTADQICRHWYMDALCTLSRLQDALYCVQIEISKTYGQTEWHDDLRKVLKLAGEANKKVSRVADAMAAC
jgi:hypothetical protein